MSEYLSRGELQGYVLTPNAEAYPIGHYPGGGIYMLFDGDGRLLYVGQSLNTGYRVVQHAWSARRGERLKFVEFTALDIPNDLMRHVEAAHIHALSPPENSHPRPDWEHHELMVCLVKKAWENTHEAQT